MAEVFRVPPLDYTSRDYVAVRDDMIRLITFFAGEWSDHNPSNFGIVLLELVSSHFDILHFYVDRMAAEAFLDTAILTESVTKLLRLIAFEIPSAEPAFVDLLFTIPVQAFDVTIPEGFQVSTQGSDPVVFETAEDLVIPMGDTQGTVGARQGETVEDNPLGVSDGTAFQRFFLTRTPVLSGTERLFVDEGAGFEEWTRVTTFVASGPADKVYRLQRNDLDAVTVFFGDNAQGKIPANLADIRTEYRIGGGQRGNVGANTIKVLIDSIPPGALPGTVTNPVQAAGGAPRMSNEEAKIQGPRQLQALGRAVTLRDYETLAQGFAGVQKARATFDSTLREVTVFVYPEGGGVIPPQLITDLTAYLNSVKMAGTGLIVTGAQIVKVLVSGTVVVRNTFINAEVETAGLEALTEFFSPSGEFVDFGQGPFLSDIYRHLDEVDGVGHVDLTLVTLDPSSTLVLEVWSGDATFSAIVTGAQAVAEEWTVQFTSPAAYTVTGSVSGLQAAIGAIDVAYVSDLGQVSFQVQSAVIPPVTGDRATFRTTPRLANVTLAATDFPELGTAALTFTGGA